MSGADQSATAAEEGLMELAPVQVNDAGKVTNLGAAEPTKASAPAKEDKRVDDLMVMGGFNSFCIVLVFVLVVVVMATPLVSTSKGDATIKKLKNVMAQVGLVAEQYPYASTGAGVNTLISSEACDDDDGVDTTKCNYCEGAKPDDDSVWSNFDCTTAAANEIEQAGANVTKGFVGAINNTATPPVLTQYYQAGLCPVNVHWHLGAEHLSVGEFDEFGSGPCDDYAVEKDDDKYDGYRRLASSSCDRRLGSGGVELGYQCHHYDSSDSKYTTEYNWEHCVDMQVGQTYEVHWPHSTVGACGTPYQYQTPFYDGVFCGIANSAATSFVVNNGAAAVAQNIGVQSQVFTIVNDESYYYPDLIKGMVVAGKYGDDVAFYTGSTTGTSRNNDDSCSAYSPITWQVDRTCHLISASSFDKMCADMKAQADDMSADLYAHGSRTLVDEDKSGWMWDTTTGKPAHYD